MQSKLVLTPKRKELVAWLITGYADDMCPHARWHESMFLWLVRVAWSWPPLFFYCGWFCIQCDKAIPA